MACLPPETLFKYTEDFTIISNVKIFVFAHVFNPANETPAILSTYVLLHNEFPLLGGIEHKGATVLNVACCEQLKVLYKYLLKP